MNRLAECMTLYKATGDKCYLEEFKGIVTEKYSEKWYENVVNISFPKYGLFDIAFEDVSNSDKDKFNDKIKELKDNYEDKIFPQLKQKIDIYSNYVKKDSKEEFEGSDKGSDKYKLYKKIYDAFDKESSGDIYGSVLFGLNGMCNVSVESISEDDSIYETRFSINI